MASKKKKLPKSKPQPKVEKVQSSWSDKKVLFPILGILAFTFLLFSNTLQHDFVNWDDPQNISDNSYVLDFDIIGIFSSNVIGNYNPLTLLSFAVEKAIFGLNPFVFHLNNVLLHLVCVFFVYRIALGLNLSPLAAGLVALLFGIHPMRVESVAWITERKDVLFGAFYLAALFQYIRYVKTNRQNQKIFWSIIGLFFLSLLSKIQAVALPLSFLAVDYWFKRPLNWSLIKEKIPYFAMSLLVGILGIVLLSEEGSLDEIGSYTFVDRLFIGGYSYLVYLGKLIYPYAMSPLYAYPDSISWHFYAGTGVSLTIIGALFYAFKKGYRVLVFSFAFFTFNVFFVLQILAAGQGFLADRFTYIPYLGFFIGLGYTFEKFKAQKQFSTIISIGTAAYLLLFAYLTWQQNKIWKNGETLWTKAIQYDENAVTPWANRGQYYYDTQQKEKAIQDYEKAIHLFPDKNTLYNSLGRIYFESNQVQRAIELYNTGLNLPNPEGEFYINRGVAYASLGQFESALKDINQGLSLDPNNTNGFLNRGLIYYSQNQLEKVIPDLERYFSHETGTAENNFVLALSYINTGNPKAAIPFLDKAIELKPTDSRYYKSRANAYKSLGETIKTN